MQPSGCQCCPHTLSVEPEVPKPTPTWGDGSTIRLRKHWLGSSIYGAPIPFQIRDFLGFLISSCNSPALWWTGLPPVYRRGSWGAESVHRRSISCEQGSLAPSRQGVVFLPPLEAGAGWIWREVLDRWTCWNADSHRPRIWPEGLHFFNKFLDDMDADDLQTPLWATFYYQTVKIHLFISNGKIHGLLPYTLLPTACMYLPLQICPMLWLHRVGQWPFTRNEDNNHLGRSRHPPLSPQLQTFWFSVSEVGPRVSTEWVSLLSRIYQSILLLIKTQAVPGNGLAKSEFSWLVNLYPECLSFPTTPG